MLKKTAKISFFIYQGLFPAVKSCRYRPSCSKYALDAIELYGVRGLWYALRRFLSCHPFSKRPIYDPA